MKALRNENGFCVILLCLMVLLTMTALGIAMLQTSHREIMSTHKLKLSTQALYSAESGNNLAAAEINSIKPDDINWSYTSPRVWTEDYVATLIELQLPGTATLNQYPFVFGNAAYGFGSDFETTVEFLWDGSDPNTILCFGYKDDGSFTFTQDTLQIFDTSGLQIGRDFWPVLRVTSTGTEGHPGHGLFKYAERNVQIQLRARPRFVFPEAALTLNGNLTNNGNPQSAIGEGHPTDTENCNVADIIGVNDTIFSYTGNTGDESKIKKNAQPYPIDEVIAALIPLGEEIIAPSNNPHWDEEKIRWHSGDLTINNLDGNGILIVKGDFTVGGNIAWNGLIIVTGDFVMNGGGTYTKYIHGSVIVGGDVTGNGNPDIYYDCEGMVDLWKASARFKQDWWREIKGRI